MTLEHDRRLPHERNGCDMARLWRLIAQWGRTPRERDRARRELEAIMLKRTTPLARL